MDNIQNALVLNYLFQNNNCKEKKTYVIITGVDKSKLYIFKESWNLPLVLCYTVC